MAQEPSLRAALELQGGTSSLDEQAQQLDAEINELIQQWELRPEDEELEDTASSVLLKSRCPRRMVPIPLWAVRLHSPGNLERG